MHNFAGIGGTCYSGDEGPCGEAGLYLPLDVACDSRNDLYICDSGSNRIRKIDRDSGIITTVVGTGEHGFNGDGPALEVNLTWPAAIAFDANDVMYIADTQAHRIRRYDPRTGLVETIAGSWSAEDEAGEQPLVARNLVVLSGDAIGIDFSDDNGWLMPVCSDGLDYPCTWMTGSLLWRHACTISSGSQWTKRAISTWLIKAVIVSAKLTIKPV